MCVSVYISKMKINIMRFGRDYRLFISKEIYFPFFLYLEWKATSETDQAPKRPTPKLEEIIIIKILHSSNPAIFNAIVGIIKLLGISFRNGRNKCWRIRKNEGRGKAVSVVDHHSHRAHNFPPAERQTGITITHTHTHTHSFPHTALYTYNSPFLSSVNALTPICPF